MIRRHKEVPTQSDMKALGQLETVCPWRRPTGRVAVAILFLAITMLACVGIRPASQSGPRRIVVATHWPTLTRTPLPTLTPTANVTPVAVALSTESAAPIPEPISSPVESERPVAPVAPGAEPILPDNSANGAPAGPVDPAVTDPNAPAAVAAVPPASSNTPAAAEVAPPASSPAPVAMATATLSPPTDTPTATATAPPTPTFTPEATPTPTPLPEGWVFLGVQLTPNQEGALLVHGDLLNNTNSPQELSLITGTFYDAQGQVLADGNTTDYWPIGAISPGGRIPFELIVPGLPSADKVDLRVEAVAGGEVPRQDFEFLDVNAYAQENDYCVAGRLRNPGGKLKSYLVLVAILYDSQDKVINYYDYYENAPAEVVGDQTSNFEICVPPLNQEVARHELQAWGL